jgi:hypothetical protein
MRTFASTTLPNYMTIVTSFNSTPYTRLTFARAAPFSGSFLGNTYNPWEYNKENFFSLVNISAWQIFANSNFSAFAR